MKISRSRFLTSCVLTFTLTLVSCGANQVPPKTVQGLQREKTVTVVAFDRKSINYDEMVYKVVYNETNTHVGSFEGIWDVDGDFDERWSQTLSKIGVQNQVAAEVLGDEAVLAHLREALGTVSLDDKLVVPADVKTALTTKGVRYIAGMRSPGFFIQANSFTPSLCQVIYGAWLVIYDLETNTQEFVEHATMMGNVTIDESPREVEAKNLALLKQHSAQLFEDVVPPLMREALGKAE